MFFIACICSSYLAGAFLTDTAPLCGVMAAMVSASAMHVVSNALSLLSLAFYASLSLFSSSLGLLCIAYTKGIRWQKYGVCCASCHVRPQVTPFSNFLSVSLAISLFSVTVTVFQVHSSHLMAILCRSTPTVIITCAVRPEKA